MKSVKSRTTFVNFRGWEVYSRGLRFLLLLFLGLMVKLKPQEAGSRNEGGREDSSYDSSCLWHDFPWVWLMLNWSIS